MIGSFVGPGRVWACATPPRTIAPSTTPTHARIRFSSRTVCDRLRADADHELPRAADPRHVLPLEPDRVDARVVQRLRRIAVAVHPIERALRVEAAIEQIEHALRF